MFITLGMARPATPERSGSAGDRRDGRGRLRTGGGRVAGFRARLFGAAEAPGQDHAPDEARRR